ncbi:hypothetical protein GWK47_047876 [Chionoecetes opilio]|uniref:CCHC-type domain-containing protein n=1 Tax=Chionoecetes opilio TaxID=41210 RepID=A0A8J4YG52_CHIOP|nr:hypothetical protein GWK47_047876 [Chionoecetes opilio]
MAVSDGNIIHTPLLLSIVKRLISQVCRFTWDTSLGDALRAPTMGHYRSDSSPHPWKRQTSRILDVALTRIRLGPHKLTQQLEGDDRREAENGDGIFAGLSIVDKWNSESKSVKRSWAQSPSQEGPDKAPRTGQDSKSPPHVYVQASYLLRATSGARVFANPSKVSHALHLSPLGKYVLEGETRSLGNGSVLIVVVWEHNIPKVPDLGQASFTLGEWEVTCRRAECDGPDYQYARVGPLDDDTDLGEVRKAFRPFDGDEVVKITWIPPCNLPRSTTGKWLCLKVRGTLPTNISISQLVYWARPYLLPLLRCPGCHRIGHSLNTCRSPVRCSRCSGPHPCRRDDITCTRPFRCFQCGAPHGPRTAFLNILAIGSRRVQTAMTNVSDTGTPKRDGRGRHKKRVTIADPVAKRVHKHIASFPSITSHYSRAKSPNLWYLDPALSVNKMYHLYSDWMAENYPNDTKIKESYYRKVFKCKELSFSPPNTDTCSFCDLTKNTLKHSGSDAEKATLQRELDAHLALARQAQTLMKTLGQDRDNDTRVIAMDLQQTQPIPRLSTNVAYYHSSLFTMSSSIF